MTYCVSRRKFTYERGHIVIRNVFIYPLVFYLFLSGPVLGTIIKVDTKRPKTTKKGDGNDKNVQ